MSEDFDTILGYNNKPRVRLANVWGSRPLSKLNLNYFAKELRRDKLIP